MYVRWRRWLVRGVVVCLLLLGIGCAETRESKVDEMPTGPCEALMPEDFNEMAAGFEGMTPEEMREFVTALADAQGQTVAEMSDDEARAMIERFVAQAKAFPLVIETWCGLRSEDALPAHGVEFPEHGELTVFGDFRTLAHMREEYDASFEETLCEKPFDLVMQVVKEKDGTRYRHLSLAYIFCERAGDFELIRAYRKSGDTETVWERFDDPR